MIVLSYRVVSRRVLPVFCSILSSHSNPTHPPHFSPSFPLSSPPLTVSSPSTFDPAMNLHVTHQPLPSSHHLPEQELTSRPHTHPDPAYPAPALPSCASDSRGRPCLRSIARVGLGGARVGVVFARGRCLGARGAGSVGCGTLFVVEGFALEVGCVFVCCC